MPRCPSLAPSYIRRWCPHGIPVDARDRVRAGMRYLARHLTIARLPPPGPPGGSMIPAQPSSAPSPPWPGSDRAAPGNPRSYRHGLAGLALAGRQRLFGQPLVPTGSQNRARIFSNYTVLAGAPLRNRTVDLLLTMHAGFAWRGRIKSDYRSSEGTRCLATSRCVCHCPEPLSLDLSLTSGLTQTGSRGA
jgi:hypothetical protein